MEPKPIVEYCTHFRHPTDEQLQHRYILFSNYYHLQSVRFEFAYGVCARSARGSQNFRVLFIMPKIPEISFGIQMERSVSVSSDRNIRDHLWRWSTYFGWNIPIEIRRSIFDKLVLSPN